MCTSNKYFDVKVTQILDGKNKTNKQGRTEIERARSIASTLGYFTAGRYLVKRNWSIDAAMFVLLGK